MRPDLIGLLVALGLCFGSMAVFRLRHDPAAHDPFESTQRGTFALGGFVKSWLFWLIHPLVTLAVKAGFQTWI